MEMPAVCGNRPRVNEITKENSEISARTAANFSSEIATNLPRSQISRSRLPATCAAANGLNAFSNLPPSHPITFHNPQAERKNNAQAPTVLPAEVRRLDHVCRVR